MSAWPPEVIRLVEAALAAHLAPEGGAAWLALHHPDAWLLAGGQVRRRQDLAPGTFAPAHQAAVEALQQAGRGVPPGSRLQAVAWQPAGPRGVATGWLMAPHDPPVALHAGVRTDGGAPTLAWLDLGRGPASPGFALGEAGMLAGFAELAARGGLPARSFLDLAFDRLRRRPEPPLALLPEQRFACHASTACCRQRYVVDVPPAAQAMLDAMPWAELGAPELAGTTLPVLPSGLLRVREAEARCTFLDPQDRCRLHLALGTPVFSACVAFPLRFTETADGYAVATSYFCGSARRNLGPTLTERRPELWDRLAAVGPTVRRPATLWLRPGTPLPPAAFDAHVDAWLAQVPAHGVGLPEALHRAGWSLAGHPGTPPALAPLDEREAEAVAASLGFWLRCLGLLGGALAPLAEAPPAPGPAHDPALLARWLRTTWHARELAYAFDLHTAHQLLLVLVAAVLALEAHHGGPLPDEAWAQLGATTSHGRAEAIFGAIGEAAPMLKEAWEQPETGLSLLRWLHRAHA